MAGLSVTGFLAKTTAEIIADVEDKELNQISPALNVQPTSLIGMINGIYAGGISELWQLAAAMYNGMDPDTATGDQLTSVCLLTGTIRDGATPTRVPDCTVNVGTAFNAAPGTMFSSIAGNTTILYTNVDEVDNPGAPANVPNIDFIATTNGPNQALAGTLTEIAVPLSGWNTITNPTDGEVGTDTETDSSLRLKRNEELATSGSATASAIRADVLTNLPLTTGCIVLHNDGDVTDGNGLPPHSIEVIARLPGATAGDNTALANQILLSKSAGIGTYGLDSEVVEDSQGFEEEIFYTRPVDVDIWIDVTVVTNASFPGDGAAQVEAALIAYGDVVYPGSTTIYAKDTAARVFDVAGVVDYTVFKIDIIASPVNTGNLSINIRETAVLDTSRINVTVI